MEKLENKGKDYFAGGKKVIPILVAGPVQFSYEFPTGQNPDEVLHASLEGITTTAMDRMALQKAPDAYLFRGLTISEPEQEVPDGVLPARKIRHGFILYFRTEPL